jgi:energy-converting hydrogenase Eha subunit B
LSLNWLNLIIIKQFVWCPSKKGVENYSYLYNQILFLRFGQDLTSK